MIVKEIGTAGYTKFTRCLFKTYLSSNDVEFLRGIKDKQKEWMLDKQSTMYSHSDLMDLTLKLYNNQKALGEWNLTIKGTTKQVESTGSKSNRELKYRALLTKQLQTLTSKLSTNPGTGNDGTVQNDRGRVIPNWLFNNPNGKKEIPKNSTNFKWCTNDCHAKPMCCDCNSCYNRTDFKEKIRKKKEESDGSEKKYQPSNNFKIALSAMLSGKDFKTLESQFLN
eukprot:15335994-Ditylum_brightwellii.AAC.1